MNDHLIINPSLSVREAIKKLDEGAKKILMVSNEEGILVGVLTDGDIRRFILNNGDLNKPVKEAMNNNPVSVISDDKKNAGEIMVKKSIEALPIVTPGNEIIDIIFLKDLFEHKEFRETKQKIALPVVIMSGGKGTRLYPYTKILPKALIPIGEKPIIEWIIDRFNEQGCTEFRLVVNHKANLIKSYFNETEHSYAIKFIDESKPLGTAGGLYLLKNKIKTDFILSNCDILVDIELSSAYNLHRTEKNIITIIGSLKHFTIPYGVLNIGKNGNLESISEKPEFDYLINTGLYLLNPSVYQYIKDDQYLNMNSLIETCLKNNEKIGVFPVSENSWTDMGQIEELEKMLVKFGGKF